MGAQQLCRDTLKSLAVCWIGGWLMGCAALPPNSLLDPTKVGQFPSAAQGYQENDIKRVLTARDTPLGPPTATEPTPSDLEVHNEEYRIVRGDTILMQIPDLIAQGQLYEVQIEVSSGGEVRLPLLGPVPVVGLTETELEAELKKRLADSQLLPNPILQVAITNKRNRVYSIIGSVAAAGPYPIPSPDFRLLDAIAFARDIGPEVKRVYVIRRMEDAPVSTATADRGLDDRDVHMLRDSRPAEERDDAYFSSGNGPGSGDRAGRSRAAEIGDDDLDALLARNLQDPDEPDAFDGIRIQREGELRDRRVPQRDSDNAAPGLPTTEPFDWDDVPDLASTQRVIEIDVLALKNGDPRYNIVVRDRDIIQVPVDTGVFYMMGEVNRPGVYGFGGREITVKQAVALAGGFSALGWPQRCEIIRREQGTDKQLTIPVDVDAVFAGKASDVLLRPDDIFNAGTHVAAPFLFVLRNSFRFTYGFGFVYDRNFADQDAYFARTNPETLAQQRRQNQGLPF